MNQSAQGVLVLLLGSSPATGELVASYLRLRLPEMNWRLQATPPKAADIARGRRGVVIVKPFTSRAGSVRYLSTLRARRPALAILIAAARRTDFTALEAFRCGAQGFLPRLSPLSALSDAVLTALARGSCFPLLIARRAAGHGAGRHRPQLSPAVENALDGAAASNDLRAKAPSAAARRLPLSPAGSERRPRQA